ncbi:2-amino-4-hydroxy-6-hydroxymethyldihydropteridine diphosphokinase [Anaerosacchariphilus polymeriproducens]|uniref:Bifunctional folate synthesis protein n=1 Tax=Anaerosacchariphilus polymeriproducens TaxID=1812858 RepID=A0A371AWC7_9FIRM|nr:2-amino-4-hydroxy-6-hydroxymethyldihydropteridine diphosphokinase [Anaerosacchariphilus polymeriproducens]RDU23877.1 2-amino-4-hydroxy-6-hydroxymethyldihydropteridine diphosphokinase [Anaerosacchariphilus polymeriproducens]
MVSKTSLDQIKIKNLEVFAFHGVFEKERKNGQSFYVDATLYLDIHKAGETDDLSYSENYGEVCHFIHDFMRKNTFLLIESVAEKLAQSILLNFPLIQYLDLVIKKPQAPIGLPFENISISISRNWHIVYVALGSNIGDKETYIRNAIQSIKEHPLCKDIRVSQLIETDPYGVTEQDNFLNGVLEVKTLLSPEKLLKFLQTLEEEAQRVRMIHWGPRTLDLDIIFYDQIIYESENLIIPHPDMQNRTFVLQPLSELSVGQRHPVLNKTVKQILDELQKKI